MIKELITIANELDKRGLVSEASAVDKIAGDLIQFDLSRRKNPIVPKPSEEEPGDLIGLNGRPIAPLMPQPETPPWAMPIVPLRGYGDRDRGRGFWEFDQWPEPPAPLGWDEIVENDYFKNPIVHPNGAEQVVESDEVLNAFIKEYLTPETKISEGDDTLESVLHTDSEDLRDYMVEVIPDLISDLSEKLNDGDSPGIHKDRIITLAKEMINYEYNDDFKYIIDKMNQHLRTYIF